MALERPPNQIVYAVERQAPGIYAGFFGALAAAHQGIPVSATSYWRSSTKNESVGGASASQHLIGTAIDLTYPNYQARQAAISRMRAQRLIVVDEGDHVHVQAWSAGTAAPLIRWLGL